ncbi:T-lymphoma invasion and metastasis-inducing protein 1 [Homalodisca vitripennis]|nr:T-lymphoma invasion and metastasis-inducing protein 1 [Homalodisca vitripennis]
MVESTSSLPKNTRIHRGGSQATMPSHSLSSRRRRNKTVHFGDTLMSEVARSSGDELRSPQEPGCESRGSVVSLPGQFDYNVQQLFTFIGTVLSAWDKDETSSEPCSQPPSHPSGRRKRHPNVLNYLLNGQNSLDGDEHLCSPTFKHRHCKLPAGSCNALFLRKVR